jgi:hypothetical protein
MRKPVLSLKPHGSAAVLGRSDVKPTTASEKHPAARNVERCCARGRARSGFIAVRRFYPANGWFLPQSPHHQLGGWLVITVMFTGGDVAMMLALSVATAVSV